jgi:protein-S-isoprenylcysteine O-methyltransferase Ste14
VLVLLLVNFFFVGLLPRIFFKREGRLNLMWWLTAAPYLLCSIALIAAFFGAFDPLSGRGTPLAAGLSPVAAVLSASSIALIAYTLGTHRQRIALWHQGNDAPQHIVTYGAYSRVRHPFYAAFLLALFGALLFCPSLWTLLTLAYGLAIMNYTAAREEQKLAASEFGEEYRAYMRRTGRFFPKLGSS